MSGHTIQWVSASPLWPGTLHGGLDASTQGERMRAPVLLRFEHDGFMDELAQTLARDPSTLHAHLATKVTYRLPAPGETKAPEPARLKLFQAAHGHFYLVAASLTCRMVGLPDHEIDVGARERVAFVLRRVDDDGTEWAWVEDTATPGAKTWSELGLAVRSAVASGEDLLPLFPVRYQNGELLRRIYVGLLPTSSGDTFKAEGKLSPLSDLQNGTGGPPKDPRPAALQSKVTDPLRALKLAPVTTPPDVTDPTRAGAIARAETDQLIEASRFLLVDFAEFLLANIPALWEALARKTRPSDAAGAAVYDALDINRADPDFAITWRQALLAAWDARLILYGDAAGDLPAALNLKSSPLTGDRLDQLVVPALPKLSPGAGNESGSAISIQGDVTEPPQVPKLDARSQWQYRIRCVYQRPECGPLQPDVISEPTEPFQIAGFFDLDAPTRPIHISLPVDTGIGDLRKLRKNVNFLISNQLRAQMNRVTNLNDALKGQFADGESFDLGLICSFSIPIITICALLVLMIFVSLLNIVFWWLPFLRICFPIGLKAKS